MALTKVLARASTKVAYAPQWGVVSRIDERSSRSQCWRPLLVVQWWCHRHSVYTACGHMPHYM
jgi:hypothetical protein